MKMDDAIMQKTYKALSDPTRRKILQLLRERDMNAGEIAEHFNSTKPTLSRHFSVLREADLIQGTKKGSTITYRLNVTVLEEAMIAMMEMFKINVGENNDEQ
jgi:ArsR family transcriptional regulator, arsenate/arsenite/antimonite-responsive transcriptional repressor